MEKTRLSNDRVYVEIIENSSEGDYIIVRDTQDQNNDPTLYTKAKRGVIKAWNDLLNSKIVENGASFHDVWNFLEEKNLNLHFYCAVD